LLKFFATASSAAANATAGRADPGQLVLRGHMRLVIELIEAVITILLSASFLLVLIQTGRAVGEVLEQPSGLALVAR